MTKKRNVILPDKKSVEYLKLLTTRMELASRFAETHDGNRDIYFSCGWPNEITFWDYYHRYKRQGIARRIVNAPVGSTWRGKPTIEENDSPKTETAFEKELQRLISELRLYWYAARADRLAGIGEYSVLFLGLSGDTELKEEVKKSKANKLLYLSAYHQGHCTVKEYEEDVKNPRFGLPKLYEIDMARSAKGSINRGPRMLGKRLVHYSRIIHIAEDLLEGEVFAEPRLESVWNNLLSLEMVTGGSAEMYWQGALPGFAFSAQPDAEFSPDDKEAMTAEIESYFNRLSRFFRLRGVDIEQLSPQVSDPSAFIDTQITQISAATGIPKRILTGSERGELASSQDQGNWNARVDERRRDFAEPCILRPLIDHLIDIQVLPTPKTGYVINWPDINALNEDQRVAIDSKRVEMTAKYVGTPGMDVYIPPNIFFRDFLNFNENTIEECMKSIEENPPREEELPEEENPKGKPKEEKEEDVDKLVDNIKSSFYGNRLITDIARTDKEK